MPDDAASEIFHLSQLINQLWGAPGGTPIRREVRASIAESRAAWSAVKNSAPSRASSSWLILRRAAVRASWASTLALRSPGPFLGQVAAVAGVRPDQAELRGGHETRGDRAALKARCSYRESAGSRLGRPGRFLTCLASASTHSNPSAS